MYGFVHVNSMKLEGEEEHEMLRGKMGGLRAKKRDEKEIKSQFHVYYISFYQTYTFIT
jgi:hypothetical protein